MDLSGKWVNNNKSGFTLIELLTVIGIIIIITTVFSVSFVRSQNQSLAAHLLYTLVTDIKSQQTKAMSGSTDIDRNRQPFGLHIGTYAYTLFIGSKFKESDPTNQKIDINSEFILETRFPEKDIVFQPLSGELDKYNANLNTITIHEVRSNTDTVISLNQYGVITQISKPQ